MKKYICIVLIILFTSALSHAREACRMCQGCDNSRIQGLLEKMTLEEKIGQLTQYTGSGNVYDMLISGGGVGSIMNVTGEELNRLQRLAVEQSRLKIPLLFGMDVIHGYRTIFPIPLGETATWDPVRVEKSARIAAIEATSAGIRWTFAPMVDIARDARWGRIAEGSGEDPYLGSVMAAARVRGFQGKDLADPQSLLACAKHYVAYGAAEGGMDYNTVDISEWTLREIYLPPFRAAVEAGAGSLMSAFNEISGIPTSGNAFTLDRILRQEWGFRGFVVSDWASIAEMLNHGNVGSEEEAVILGLEVGVDMEMVSGLYQKHLEKLVEEGRISEAMIDRSVKRVLHAKAALGLFDSPYADTSLETKTLLAPEHLTFARDLAARSMVLLKNEALLPLKKGLKSIALIGPLADSRSAPLGFWHCQGKDEETITVLEGFKAKLPGVRIHYAKGCAVDAKGKESFKEAVDAARKAEAVVLVVGEEFDMSGEGASRSDIGLPGNQLDLVKAVHAAGKPVVVVLMNGRPLAIPWIAQKIPAILEAWQPGTQSGHAVADVLFGDVNPAGKLPVSFPRATGQVPLYYNHKNTGRPPQENRFSARYTDIDPGPQFPFGHGLSYTSFEYGNLDISSDAIRPAGTVTVSADVRNTGKREGDETVQLYIRDLVGSRTRPVKELKGFTRITLKPGESKRVSFILGPSLGFYDRFMNYRIEPGTFRVWIGPNSTEGLEGEFRVIE